MKDVCQGVSLVTRKKMGMLLRERKKSHVGRKGEKYLDVLYVEIKIPEKIFYRRPVLNWEKNCWELSSIAGVRDNGLRFLAYQELQIQIPPGSRQVMKMRIKYDFKNPTYVHSKQ